MTAPAEGLVVHTTPIPGLIVVDLPVHGDARGWFKENWQRAKMTAAGVPDFGPVQQNMSFNDTVGTTRGIHAEPWDKWVSVGSGRIFGAWVDLRQGPGFGTVYSTEVGADRAVFVPRGVGNAFQTLEPATTYAYLVNDHWSPDSEYVFLNVADETVAVPWPIPLGEAVLSKKDREHPRLADVTPLGPRKVLVVGADGQLGRALRRALGSRPEVEFASRSDLDLASGDAIASARRWRDYDAIINAAAFTAVDLAETEEGRATAWQVNVAGVSALARVAAENSITLVVVSSDYVFDGSLDRAYREDDAVMPLGVYGQTKAAGDLVAATAPRHYIVRTSWVMGDGRNFVRTMRSLAQRGISPRVVADQVGRPTFADDLARAIAHLLSSQPAFGIYNVTGAGDPTSWAELARLVFAATGHDPDRVAPVTTTEYTAGSPGPVAPRPKNGVLDLDRIRATGFEPRDWRASLTDYLAVTAPDPV